jgi:hypothetical protein
MLLKTKLHRRVEKAFKLKKNILKVPIETLQDKFKFTDSDVLQAAKECAEYCIENKNDFHVVFNLYVSCLKNPKNAGTGVQ